ncbi:hypothetical protein [uncultured Piscinibacter sp.]|uniref:hypothetical protein n=1 Tax=uncultured Piscinibacter sp. TaxID=1131835 RepID=UPI00261481A0|nr:hypothetical protein [uncultured Piscinibacter sp.]
MCDPVKPVHPSGQVPPIARVVGVAVHPRRARPPVQKRAIVRTPMLSRFVAKGGEVGPLERGVAHEAGPTVGHAFRATQLAQRLGGTTRRRVQGVEQWRDRPKNWAELSPCSA